jgi:hypothetical protein
VRAEREVVAAEQPAVIRIPLNPIAAGLLPGSVTVFPVTLAFIVPVSATPPALATIVMPSLLYSRIVLFVMFIDAVPPPPS